LAAAQRRQVTWIALAMNDDDRAFARSNTGGPTPKLAAYPNISLRLVDAPEDAYHRYYNGVSNQLLWFTQHYLLRPGVSPVTSRMQSDWDAGYLTVNEAVARAVLEELSRTDEAAFVLFQDYHLYLAPGIVREQAPWARLAHFVHIPWPDSRYWELLPETMTQAIFASLAANDLIGFQTERDARNFVDGALRFLPDASQASAQAGEAGALLVDGRRVSVHAYPIAISPSDIFAQARQEPDVETTTLLARARPTPDHKVILRVDRLDPTKNIVTGFRAYERLLRQHKELRERVTFLALLVPSRQDVPAYRAAMRQTLQIIKRINQRFGTPTWQPIIAIFEDDRRRALACMREFDVLLVNPVIDGMNMVVKEGALVNERAGAIVLSRTAGAYEQLGQYTFGVSPGDVAATANALYEALRAPKKQRRANLAGMTLQLLQESSADWLNRQIRDLAHGRQTPLFWQVAQESLSIEHSKPVADAIDAGNTRDAPEESVSLAP
jgi:trehalose 6-phosphate synthase